MSVDHLDGNSENDVSRNLVPSCIRCNVNRGNDRLIQPGELVIRSSTSHTRVTRAEERHCEICHQPFLHMIAKRDPKKGRFCSRSCANRGRYFIDSR